MSIQRDQTHSETESSKVEKRWKSLHPSLSHRWLPCWQELMAPRSRYVSVFLGDLKRPKSHSYPPETFYSDHRCGKTVHRHRHRHEYGRLGH